MAFSGLRINVYLSNTKYITVAIRKGKATRLFTEKPLDY